MVDKPSPFFFTNLKVKDYHTACPPSACIFPSLTLCLFSKRDLGLDKSHYFRNGELLLEKNIPVTQICTNHRFFVQTKLYLPDPTWIQSLCSFMHNIA